MYWWQWLTSQEGDSLLHSGTQDRQKIMSYDAHDQTILGIFSHIPCSCQYPIWRLSFETVPCFAISCPAVGFPSVLPVQQTGLSQPVWLSDSAVYSNNETAVNPIWHVFGQSEATSFSGTGKAFKQVSFFWWGWNRAAAPLLKPECSVMSGVGFIKHFKSWKGQRFLFKWKKKLMILTVTFFSPLFFFLYIFSSRANCAVNCRHETEWDSTERIIRKIFNSRNGLLHQRWKVKCMLQQWFN